MKPVHRKLRSPRGIRVPSIPFPRSGRSVLAVLTLVLAPAGLSGQAICSAPHSSPTLTQSGAVRTLPVGTGWLQLSAYGQNATESFNPDGDRQAFLGNARFDTRSLYLTGAVGLAEGLEVWGQLPVHRLSVDGDGGSSTTEGLGDVRAAVRLSPALLAYEWPVALRLGLKVPGGDFPVDATVLPLTEGQVDYEVSLETGWAPQDWPFYAVAWAGYRWRTADTDTEYEPGDERFAHLAAGASAGNLHVEVGLDGLWGRAPTDQRVVLGRSARRLLQVLPTVGLDVGAGRLEVTVPVPVWGRNLPSDPGVSVGFRKVWGM